MARLEHDLGRSITERASHRGQHFILAVKHFGNAKIGQDQVRICCPREIEQVFWFQVCTRDSTLVAGGTTKKKERRVTGQNARMDRADAPL